MAKRRARYIKKTFSIRTGEKIDAHKTIVSYPKARRSRKPKQLELKFDDRIKKDAERFIKDSLKKKRGNRFIVTIKLSQPYRNRRGKITTHISARRQKIKTKRGLELSLESIRKEFAEKMKAYLARKAVDKLQIDGAEFEVIKKRTKKRGKPKKSQTARRRKARKKAVRRSRH